jgi:small subunit ribosomal protein S8
MTDPIADMLTRIRNAQLAKKHQVLLPWSKIKQKIAEVLVAEGYLAATEKVEENFGQIKLTLNKSDRGPAIRSITRISKPARRVYVGKGEIPRVLGGQGLAIISTSQGILTDKEARQRGLGGEVICEIY